VGVGDGLGERGGEHAGHADRLDGPAAAFGAGQFGDVDGGQVVDGLGESVEQDAGKLAAFVLEFLGDG